MKTEQQARHAFAAYFLDLKASLEREGAGAKANKQHEWETCIAHWVSEGEAPAEAVKWKCPRSLESELQR